MSDETPLTGSMGLARSGEIPAASSLEPLWLDFPGEKRLWEGLECEVFT